MSSVWSAIWFLVMKHVDKAGGGDTTTGCSHGKGCRFVMS